MARLHLLVAVGCIAAGLVGQAFGEECVLIGWGALAEVPITSDPVTLSAGIRDWQVPVPQQCAGHLVGLQAKVCDYDVAPEATFENLLLVSVHRKGDLNGDGSVTLSYFCTPSEI